MSLSSPKKTVQEITKKSKSNFLASFFFLPKRKRDALTALYAFCRLVDDIVDSGKAGGQAQIDWWRAEIKQIKKGRSNHPVSSELAKAANRFHIPLDYFDDLLKGVEMDLHKNRYQTFEELYDYCYHVASVVGLISLKIFETTVKESELYAINLGIALQLTNILRDVEEDLERGRVYIPQDDLHRFGFTDRDLHHRTYNKQFTDLMSFEVERAKEYYRLAEGFSMTRDWKKLVSAQIMGNIYYAVLEEIEKSDFAVFEKRASLGKSEKIAIALSTYFKNRYLWLTGIGRK